MVSLSGNNLRVRAFLKRVRKEVSCLFCTFYAQFYTVLTKRGLKPVGGLPPAERFLPSTFPEGHTGCGNIAVLSRM